MTKNLLRKHVYGINSKNKTHFSGSERRYINFDNSASTPSLKCVMKDINNFMINYSSVHRGSGFKSRYSSEIYEKARKTAGTFVNYNPEIHTVIFTKNSTDSINLLASRLDIPSDAVIITTPMEHHSNDLPWRNKAKVLYAPLNPVTGAVDLAGLEELIKKNKKNFFLLAISGASNVSGIINPVHKAAEIAHKYRGLIAVDCAQLIPHRQVNISGSSDSDYLDFASFSGHKLYAPFGTGVLVGNSTFFKKGAPRSPGGGTVKAVTTTTVEWEDLPHMDEPGSPNVPGAVALMSALNFYNTYGYEMIEQNEYNLTNKTLRGLNKISDIEIYGPPETHNADLRLGVISFNMKGINYLLLSSVLAHKYNIGVRSGCFCAHHYLKTLIGIKDEDEGKFIEAVKNNEWEKVPGAVRISFGFYNTLKEVEALLEALKEISENKDSLREKFVLNSKQGEYFPEDFRETFRI